MKLDPLDIKILAALQADGRLTKLKLAEMVNLSPSACFERMKRLETAGYVRGYHAEIALDKLVRTTLVMVEVTLRSHAAADFQRFEEAIVARPEVMACHGIGGGIDYILKIVALDVAHYQRIMDELLGAEIGIERYFTYIVTREVKDTAEWPVATLLEKSNE